jgi:hypothetical protein
MLLLELLMALGMALGMATEDGATRLVGVDVHVHEDTSATLRVHYVAPHCATWPEDDACYVRVVIDAETRQPRDPTLGP